MSKIYNDDNIQELIDQQPGDGVIPRGWLYRDDPNDERYQMCGAVPVGAAVDELVDPRDYKEVIQFCHDKEIFPVYHQYNSWCPQGERWTQDGLPYCWTWGITGNMMDCRAREGKETVMLSPVSLGWTVNWQSRGNYLMSAIRGMKERGVCEQSYTPNIHSRNWRAYKDGWQENALKYRLAEYWDLDNRSDRAMVQHMVTVLATGTPLYIAHNYWSHALSIVAIEYDSSGDMVYVHRNSHNESDVIRIKGGRGIPDEAYGIRATLLTE